MLPAGLGRERREVDRRRGGRVDTSLKPFGGVSVHLFLEESGLGWGGVFFFEIFVVDFLPQSMGGFSTLTRCFLEMGSIKEQ